MLRNLVAKELRARYKGSVLGFLWTFVHPLMMIIVYTLVFKHVMQIQQENYSLFLFVALLPWNFTSQSILQATASMVQGANLVKKVYFPRSVLPLAVVTANLVNFMLSLLILVPAILLSGVPLGVTVLAFPVVMAVHALLVIALSVLGAIGNVYFRDLEHITTVFMNAWLFLSPVFYSSTNIPPAVKPLFYLNPLTLLIESYRNILLLGVWPNWAALGGLAAVVLLVFVASFSIFAKAQGGAAEQL